MENIGGFDFFRLTIDENGKLTSGDVLEGLKQRAASATAVIFLSHGWRNDVNDATTLYTNFLTNYHSHFARPECAALTKANFAVAGIYWPSLIVPEHIGTPEGSTQSVDPDAAMIAALTQKLSDLKDLVPGYAPQIDQAIQLLPRLKQDGDAQNQFTDLLLSPVKDQSPDPTEGFDSLLNQDGTVILRKLSPSDDSGTSAGNGGGVDSVGSVQGIGSSLVSILQGADTFINFTTWWIMKNRSGVVGATGVAQAVRELAASKPDLQIHLVGHSLGGRVMASCCKSLAQDPIYHPASVTLLEAAFSHYGFSGHNSQGKPGFFRDVIEKKVVKGPLLATFSEQDTVVGTIYALASRVVRDNVSAIGDSKDPYGGLGHNGAVETDEKTVSKLQTAGNPYQFQIGVVSCLDGSGGLIKDHGDVTNPDVTYAFACSVASTQTTAASAT